MKWLIEAIFPRKCVVCGKWGRYLCQNCEVGRWEMEQICPNCGEKTFFGVGHRRCVIEGKLDGLVCFWENGGVVRKLLWRAKYSYRHEVLKELVEDSLRLLARDEFREFRKFLLRGPVVVPVLLYKGQEKWRGFNPGEVVGKVLERGLRLEMVKWLVRKKDTTEFKGKSRRERQEGLKGAFGVAAIKGKLPERVVLVDDTWRTGATMWAGAGVLKKAGVKQVWGLVVAR